MKKIFKNEKSKTFNPLFWSIVIGLGYIFLFGVLFSVISSIGNDCSRLGYGIIAYLLMVPILFVVLFITNFTGLSQLKILNRIVFSLAMSIIVVIITLFLSSILLSMAPSIPNFCSM